MAGNVNYIALIKAVQSGDWKGAKEFLKLHPNALSEKITFMGKTALHIAVAAGHVHIVEEMVERMSEENLEIRDNGGLTALAETAYVGNHRMAECMVRKNKHLVSIEDKNGFLPVVIAMEFGYKDLARYLYSLTPLEDLMPEKGISGATLCTQAIYTRTLGKKLINNFSLLSRGDEALNFLFSMFFNFISLLGFFVKS
jgi:ankyrin repeat protein